MTLANLLRAIACLVALVALMLVCSCGDNPCELGDEAEYSRTTPENLLNHLAESFSAKRLDWYSECLDEAFRFVPTERDADTLGLPATAPWLERSRDITAVGRIFREGYVGNVGFDLLEIEGPAEGDEEGTLFFRTTQDILLEIECPGGDPISFVVQETYLDFVVAEDPANEGLWVVRTMTESRMDPGLAGPQVTRGWAGGTSMATNPSTLGYVKSIFLKGPASMRTVDKALDTYARSIEAKDIGTYGDCLDFDHRFIFMDDVADSLHLPPEAPWWTKSQDLDAMTSMFGHAQITNISFECDVVSRDTSWTEGGMTIGLRVQPYIWLTYERPGEEPFSFVVNNEFMDFRFIGRGCCSDRWTVLSVEEIPLNPIRDKNIGQALTESMSWGAIKALFMH